MTIGEKIKKGRIQKGFSQEYLARAIGSTKQAIYKYECGLVTNIPMDKVETIADLLGVSPSYLMGWEDQPADDITNSLRPVATKHFRMLGEIACGEPIFANEDHKSYIDASADIKADFCLTARGDSMIGARIHDGDVVFIKAMPIVENGEIAAVIIDGEATLKRWYYDPTTPKLVLAPENSAYPPLVYVGEELDTITCLGKAVCFMSNL